MTRQQGIWSTDVPLSRERMSEQHKRLQQLMAALDADDVIVSRMTVWIDGVEWEYRYVR